MGWEWMSPPFKLCHGEGTTNQDNYERRIFNEEYDDQLLIFGGRDKCMHCDCYIDANCNHGRCEKVRQCAGDGCSKVAAHCYQRKNGYMLLVRTCRSCNSSSGCFTIEKSREGRTLVYKLKRKVDDYELWFNSTQELNIWEAFVSSHIKGIYAISSIYWYCTIIIIISHNYVSKFVSSNISFISYEVCTYTHTCYTSQRLNK